MPLSKFLAAKKGMPWLYRIKVLSHYKPTEWSNFLSAPKEGFLESYSGHLAISDIEYIEINPFEVRHMGRMESDKRFDHSKGIEYCLSACSLPFSIVDQYYRIDINQKAAPAEPPINALRAIVKIFKTTE